MEPTVVVRGRRRARVACVGACLLVWLTLHSAAAHAQSFLEWSGLKVGPHAVGFRTWVVTDESRTVGRPVDFEGRPRPSFGSRRVQVALWYPAAHGVAAKVMKWGDYFSLLTLDGTAAATEVELAALRAMTPGASPEAAGVMSGFRARPVRAWRDGRPAAGRFPVVIYAPGGDYPVFDNSVLCELLASHGFVVIATPSSGAAHKALGFTTLDLEAGARDLELLAGQVRSLAQADPERLAVMGFSWGGIPAGLLAMRNGRVRSLVSLDSTLGDASFTKRTQGLAGFEPSRLRLPVLAFTTGRGKGLGVAEDSPLGAARQADLTRVTLSHAEHHDLSSFSALLRRSSKPASAEVTATYELVCRLVLAFFEATLRERPWRPEVDAALATVERRTAREAELSVDDVLDLVDARGAEGALEVLRARRDMAGSAFAPLEPVINLAGYMELLHGRSAAALSLFDFNVESFPESFNAWDSLAEGHLGAGSLADADRCYRETRARVEREASLTADARAAHLSRIDAALTRIGEPRDGG